MLKDECPTNGGEGWVRALDVKSIVQPGAIILPLHSQTSNQGGPVGGADGVRGGMGWLWLRGRLLLSHLDVIYWAYFESPAASCTPCHSHWSCPDLPPRTALQPLLSLRLGNTSCKEPSAPRSTSGGKRKCFYVILAHLTTSTELHMAIILKGN